MDRSVNKKEPNANIDTGPTFQSPEPYPPIKVEGKNKLYAGLMHGNLVASASEMTAVCQYLYDSWILESQRPDAAKTMHAIAKVEMHHLDIFGNLVRELGGDPTYAVQFRQRKQVWNGGYVSNHKNFFHLMQRNLLAEQDTIAKYLRQASMIQDSNISAILRRIVLDEQVHVQIFRSFLDECIR
ncbi:ferritin-like domain-containing protein [Clostridium sp. D33t1_170424_F3]|uniref:ferritin-like domain-containing protein n=1 Tax=Clostridium sp. D33t1_170424_F3 TaxID=2787099 RepID=UPI0018AC1923